MTDWKPTPAAAAVLGQAADIRDRLALSSADATTLAKVHAAAEVALFHPCTGPKAETILIGTTGESDESDT